jgi:hypothetical protein
VGRGEGKRKWKGYIWLRIRRGAREFNIGIYIYINWLVAAKCSLPRYSLLYHVGQIKVKISAKKRMQSLLGMMYAI